MEPRGAGSLPQGHGDPGPASSQRGPGPTGSPGPADPGSVGPESAGPGSVGPESVSSVPAGLELDADELPPRSRGVIGLLEENCTVCMLCARECPDWCIYIE